MLRQETRNIFEGPLSYCAKYIAIYWTV